MRTVTITRSRVAAAAVAVSMAAAGVVGFATSSSATAATYQVTPKNGPGGDNNAGGTSGQPASAASVITVTGTGNAFKSAAGVVKVATVTWATSASACAQGSNALSGFAVPTASQVVVTVPANTLPLAGTTTFTKKEYTICVYDAVPTLLGTAKYTVYPTPTITAAVSPAKGSVSGGGTIAIDGTGFTATSVVKVGGVAATQVKVATDGKSLTAKVPAGTAGATSVTITNEGGTNPTPTTASWDDFTYVNTVSVSPSTGQGGSEALTVSGVGFKAINFSTAKVILGLEAYDHTKATNEDCGSVQVVSDTQLVCTLDGTVADGAYTVYVVTTPATDSTASGISSGATYTVADF